MGHKSGRQFSGTGVRGFRTSLQDDVEDEYSSDGRGILNFGKEYLQIGLCARQNIECESVGHTISTAIFG